MCLLRGTDWIFMCFVWISEQTAIISLYSINWLVFITETECVYWVVRTGSLCNSTFCPHSVFMCFVWIWEQTAIISLYSINWLFFITETECVYCAVRMGLYRGADKSLAWADWKNNWNVAIFRPTRRSLLPRRPGWKSSQKIFFQGYKVVATKLGEVYWVIGGLHWKIKNIFLW